MGRCYARLNHPLVKQGRYNAVSHGPRNIRKVSTVINLVVFLSVNIANMDVTEKPKGRENETNRCRVFHFGEPGNKVLIFRRIFTRFSQPTKSIFFR